MNSATQSVPLKNGSGDLGSGSETPCKETQCSDSSCRCENEKSSHLTPSPPSAEDAEAESSTSPFPKAELKAVPPVEEMNATVATQYGRLDRVRHIFATQGIDVNEPDAEGCYLMHWAAINNRVDLIKFFLSVGAMVDQLGGDLYASPLHWAVRSGHLESVVVLIRAGADPLIKDKEGLNCVMVASAFEHSQCLAYILAKLGYNFDINAVDNECRTAALWASCRNHDVTSLRLLLSCGANLDTHDSKKRSPLHWAAFIGSVNGVKFVLKSNQCDPTRRDVDGMTALDYAENSRNRQIYVPMLAYDWRFRRRIGQARPRGLFGAFLEQLRFNDDIHRKFIAIVPVLFYLFVGFLLEQSMSYWLKLLMILAVFYPVATYIRVCVQSEDVLMMLPLYISLGTKFWLYSSYFAFSYQLRSAPWFINLIFWTVIPLGLYFFYKAVNTEPGTIAANYNKDVFNKAIIERAETQSDQGGEVKLDDFCFTCLVRRPLRSKHCSTCDKCVARFDHHCPWIANCVALDNLKYFIGYLLFLAISLFWDMHGNVIYALSQHGSDVKWDGGVWSALALCWSLATASPWAAWNYINAAVYGIGVAVLFTCQIYQACLNITSNERLCHFKYKHFRDERTKKFVNPFRRGLVRNFFDSLDIGIPKLIQPTPIDWRRCYSMREVEFHYNGQGSPSKLA